MAYINMLADELTRLRRLARQDVEEVRWYEQDCISAWQQFKDCVRCSTVRKTAVVHELWAAVHGMFLTGPWGRGPTQWVRERLDPRLRRMYYMLAKWVWPERHSRISRYKPYDYRWDFSM